MFGISKIVSNLLGRGNKRLSEGQSPSEENSNSNNPEDERPSSPPRKKIKIGTDQNGTATDDDLTAVLKGELDTIQRSMTTQIQNLGNKFKEIEEGGKKREEENKNLKDLLYRGSMEIKTEKDKMDDLREKNKQLMDLLKLTEKNIEENMKQSAQLLKITRAKVGEAEITGEGKSNRGCDSEVPLITSKPKTVTDLNLMTSVRVENVESPVPEIKITDAPIFLENCACKTDSGSPLNLSGNNNSQSNSENSVAVSRFLNPVIVNSSPTKAILDCPTNSSTSLSNPNPSTVIENSENPSSPAKPADSIPPATSQAVASDSADSVPSISSSENPSDPAKPADCDSTPIASESGVPAPSSSPSETPVASTSKVETSEPAKIPVEEAYEEIPSEAIDESLSFSALGGLEDQVKIVRENILFPLVNKEALEQCGIDLAKGFIFNGQIGSGKLIMAKTLAAELSRVLGKQFSFFRRFDTDVFPRYSDKSSKYVKNIFKSAKAKAPAVIFLNDLETLCGYMDYIGSEDATVKLVALEMEAVKSDLIIVIAATNNLTKIDSALRRPGRFERVVSFPVPNLDRRRAILSENCGQWKVKPSQEILDTMAKKITDWSSIDIKQLCRQSFLVALNRQFSIGGDNNKDSQKDTVNDKDAVKTKDSENDKGSDEDKNSEKDNAKAKDSDETKNNEKDRDTEENKDKNNEKEMDTEENKDKNNEKEMDTEENKDKNNEKEMDTEENKDKNNEKEMDNEKNKVENNEKEMDTVENQDKNNENEMDTPENKDKNNEKDKSMVSELNKDSDKTKGNEENKATEKTKDNEEVKVTEKTKDREEEKITEKTKDNEEEKITEKTKDREEEKITEKTKDNEEEKITEKTKDNEEEKVTEKTRDNEENKAKEKVTDNTKNSEIEKENDKCTQKLDITALNTIKVLPEDWSSAFDSIVKNKSLASAPARTGFGANSEEAIAPEVVDANLRFDCIGGLEEQMENVRENILFPMLNKDSLLDWGVEPVKGIIFHGPPGTGKTLLAKSLAAELSRLGGEPFSFFYRKGTDSYRKYVGETESYLRTVFAKAVAKKPAILFFDEIDGLCATRKEGTSSNFYNGVVTTMLGLMDSVKRGEVFVIAATNRLDSLDPALTRPGRFDKAIAFYPPKEEGRKSILRIHSSKWKRGNDEEILAEIAKQTEGYTGADLEQLCRQTFLSGLRRRFPVVGNVDFTGSRIVGFEDFDILLQDWYTALGTVRGSNNGAFGNSVSIGKAIPPGVSRLIHGIENEIVEKLKPFLNGKAGVYLPGVEKGIGIKSFLIWDTGIRQSRVIEHFIIPSLTSSVEFKDTTTFTLGDDKIESSNLKSFMNQILTCSKTAILYIPRIEELGTKLTTAKTQHLFMEQMDSLRGENVLLIASGGCPISELPEDFRHLFKGMQDTREYKVRKFERAECREFFTPILQEPLLARAEGLAHSANFYDILDLKSELSQASVAAKAKGLTEIQLTQNLAEILNSFETNKLDSSGPRNNMYS